MAETTKAKVGLLGLMVELYDRMFPELRTMMTGFGQELAASLAPYADVDFPGVCNTRERVEQAVAQFEADGKDLILVVLLTYAPSAIVLRALKDTRLPIVIFNTQQLEAVTPGVVSMDTTRNHGMHGVQDLANVLLRAGRPFHIVTGHYRDPRALREIQAWCGAARAARAMAQARIGLIGYPLEGMGDIFADETAFLGQLGVEVHHIAMKAVAEAAKAAPGAAIAEQMAEDCRNFQVQPDVTPAAHEASARLEWALRQQLRERGLHGFAFNFGAIEEEQLLDTVPFLAASKLLAEGYGFGGEGDVTCATAVVLMKELAGAANFVEMFTMDFKGNAALLMHMGECNWKMARRGAPIHLMSNTLALGGLRFNPLLLAFSMEPGEITLTSLTTTTGGRLKLVVGEGQIVDFPFIPDLARPHSKFRPDGDLCDFLTRFSMEGGTHHQAIAYGRWASTIEKVADVLGIECARV